MRLRKNIIILKRLTRFYIIILKQNKSSKNQFFVNLIKQTQLQLCLLIVVCLNYYCKL